jgi:hypothetical protein
MPHCVTVPIKTIKQNYILGITDDTIPEGQKTVMCSKEQSQDLGKGVKEKYAVKEITCTES